MHTVISWRSRPETRRYIRYENPCIVLLGNAICYVISGLILLVVGVIITSLTFQNLERYENEKTERYAGPILIVVGILVLARGAFSQIKAKRTTTQQSFVIRSYTGELLTRPIMEYSSNSLTMCGVSIAEAHEYPRLSIYDDEPPAYHTVIDNQRHVVQTRDESTQSPEDYTDPPPTYEEFLQHATDTNETSSESNSLPEIAEHRKSSH